MKLDKIEPTKKKISKKIVIIGILMSIIIVFCAVAGWKFWEYKKDNILKIAQNLISGQSTDNFMSKANENSVDMLSNELDEGLIKGLETSLQKLKYGFTSEVGLYGVLPTERDDIIGKITKSEELYLLCNPEEKERKPKQELFENPERKIEIKRRPEEYKPSMYVVSAKCEYAGIKAEVKVVSYTDYIQGEKKAEEELKKTDEWIQIMRKYESVEFWRKKRNKWIVNRKDQGFFEEATPDTTYDDYTNFWTKIAGIKEGIVKSFNDELDKDTILKIDNVLYKKLNPDGDGNQGGGDGPTGPTNPDGDGNQGGGDGTGGNEGGNSGKPEEPVDKVAPSITNVTIASPASGTYREGQEIRIKVDFDKNVYGTDKKVSITQNTAPKLLIKFGEKGENKLATFDSVNGKTINYLYKIEKQDSGKLQLGEGDNYIGTIYNVSGVKADLTKIDKFGEDKEIIADNLGPVVEKIETITKEGNYKTGDKVELKVFFNEKIYATKDKTPIIEDTVPILQIYFGEGEKKLTTYKNYDETTNSLLYEYTITNEDRGELKIDVEEAFIMKEIYDAIGNKTDLIIGKELIGNVIIANSDLTQITFDKKEITLDLNGMKTAQINATVKPENKKLTWETADKNIAIVDETGKVTGIAIGETTIIAKAEDGAQAIFKVTVKDTTNGNTKVKLNKERLELDLNGTKEEKLIATIEPKEMEITWSSSDKNIATVDETGKVVAISAGETQIIAKAKDGTTAICAVIVTNSNKNEIEPTSIETNIKNIQVVLGRTQTLQLKTTVVPLNSNKNAEITYKSSNENVAVVDETGKITIKGKGVVIITTTTTNGKKAYSTIEVVEVAEDSNLKIGDINKDGKIDTTDLLLLLRHMAVISSEKIANKHQDWILEGEKFIVADVNSNGIVDVTDALKIQRHMAASKSEIIKENHPDWVIITSWNAK